MVVYLKVVMISCSILLFLALAMKVSVPIFSQLPSNWNTLRLLSWLRPPYIYVIFNGIIIGIAVSSLFHRDRPDDKPVVEVDSDHDLAPEHFVHKTKIIHNYTSYRVLNQHRPRVYEHIDHKAIAEEVIKTMVDHGYQVTEPEFAPEAEDQDNDDDDVLISNSTWKPPDIKNIEPSESFLPAEKPLVSSRFSHRIPVKTSPQGGGRALKVSKPRRHETLENTWKMITEGRSEPLSRQKKMCDTWENNDRPMELGYDEIEESPIMNKLETVKDWTNYQKQLGPVKMSERIISRKEPSLSQDDLNRRVEEFINKFNEDMRLQRQQSLQQYTETIRRGNQQ